MDAETLYQHIKEAIHFFGLNWADKDKITVKIIDDELRLTYQNYTISIKDSV